MDEEFTCKKLSPQLVKTVELVCAGYSAKAIASKLNLTRRTVEFYIARIYKISDVRSRDELIDLRREGGLDKFY